MIPTFALVGRPNVGKSTLFNRLTRSRDALVADQPGLTRDRHYGRASMHGQNFLLIDTAGFDPSARDGIVQEMARQAEQAIAEADMLLFLVDARQGLTPHDEEIAVYLRRSHKRVQVVVNKAEGQHGSFVTAEFHRLGLGEPVAISASHGEGVVALMSALLPEQPDRELTEESRGKGVIPRIAIAGRPNVGKSTLINALLGEERVIAFDAPGTTRDAISISFEYAQKPYTLVDTAGLRRKGKVFETVEKFSVIKTLQAIEDANVVVLVLDASQDIADQDAHIAGFILEAGRSLVLVVNKWDVVDNYRRDQIKQDIGRKLGFLSFASTHTISALHGKGLNAVMKAVDQAYAAAMKKFSTPKLTRVLQEAVARQAPPRDGVFRPKLRYAHQGGMNPPVVVIHGTSLEKIPASYIRFLEHAFTDAFRLKGTPLRIRFKNSHNPYKTQE